MTIDQFLGLFPKVKPTKDGWLVNCPAHDDRHPSLAVAEGDERRILIHCYAACTHEAICAALGLEESDLFADSPVRGMSRPLMRPPRKATPQQIAFAFELHALDLRRQADKILEMAGRCADCDTWTDEERDQAMTAVARAYQARERAAWCESYADHVRGGHVAA